MDDAQVIEGACVEGDAIPAEGCLCEEIPRQTGWCCADGWRPFACEPDHVTCADLNVPNCVEVWPGEARTGYEYEAGPEVYFFRDLSNEDHYFLLMGDIDCTTSCAVFGFQDGEGLATITSLPEPGHRHAGDALAGKLRALGFRVEA